MIAKGDESHNDRLEEIYNELEAIGAHSAEARARRILAVSDSNPNQKHPSCKKKVAAKT